MKRIRSFDALRFIFCITIFLNHCTFFKDSIVGDYVFEHMFHNGRFGVTFFFLVSGFCLYRRYGDANINLKSYPNFVLGKLKKIYVLYMVTNFVVAFYELYGGGSFIKILCKLLLVATMIQTSTVRYWSVLNSAGWFLSTLFVLYLISPFLLYVVNRINEKAVYIWTIILVFLVPFGETMVYFVESASMISSDTSMLLTYVFPVYWIPAYAVGMMVSKWKMLEGDTTYGETLAIILVILCYFIGIGGAKVILTLRSIIYIFSNALLIYVFSFEQGKISRLLAESRLANGGGYCMEIYLIHFVVINFGGKQLLSFLSEDFVGELVETILLFAVTVCCSYLWKMIYRKSTTLINQKRISGIHAE